MTHMWIRIYFILVVLWASQICGAQSLYDGSNMLIGRIESDGLVRDQANMMIGKIGSDGTILNRNYMTVGKIDKDGTIRDART